MKPTWLPLGVVILALHVSCSESPERPMQQSPEPPPATTPSELNPAPPSTNIGPAQSSAKLPDPDSGEPKQPECIPVFKQTGPGCNLPEIERRIKELRRPAGPVARCYRASLSSPQSGTVKFRITLEPSGSVGSIETLADEFPGTRLSTCLADELRALTLPAPGDVPCVVVHTFPFVL